MMPKGSLSLGHRWDRVHPKSDSQQGPLDCWETPRPSSAPPQASPHVLPSNRISLATTYPVPCTGAKSLPHVTSTGSTSKETQSIQIPVSSDPSSSPLSSVSQTDPTFSLANTLRHVCNHTAYHWCGKVPPVPIFSHATSLYPAAIPGCHVPAPMCLPIPWQLEGGLACAPQRGSLWLA